MRVWEGERERERGGERERDETRQTWSLKSWRILMIEAFNPGISKPFWILRINLIGSISDPTLFSKPLMKATTATIKKMISIPSYPSSSSLSSHLVSFPNTSASLPKDHDHSVLLQTQSPTDHQNKNPQSLIHSGSLITRGKCDGV